MQKLSLFDPSHLGQCLHKPYDPLWITLHHTKLSHNQISNGGAEGDRVAQAQEEVGGALAQEEVDGAQDQEVEEMVGQEADRGGGAGLGLVGRGGGEGLGRLEGEDCA
ncbi:hypothetical protein Fmac_012912 [Flemingia macrophylla]|uniref:Uncharacterized protein n=1 Tax=Flemingia macrophylla TaxID=520843 RepID=A0ABD1MRP0_9FABA